MAKLTWSDGDGDEFEAMTCGEPEKAQGKYFVFACGNAEYEVSVYVTLEQVRLLIDFLDTHSHGTVPRTPEEVEQWLNAT